MATYWENSCSFGLRYVSWYKYLIVSLVFSHLGFWSGNLFLIAPFPDLCLLVPFDIFLIFAQNIDCGHTLVPTIDVLEQNKKNMYTPIGIPLHVPVFLYQKGV